MGNITMNFGALQGTAANGSEKAGNGSAAVSVSGSGLGKRQRRGIRLKEEPTPTPPEPPESEGVGLDGSVDVEAMAAVSEVPAPGFNRGGASTPVEDWEGYRTAPLSAPVFDRADVPDYLKGRNTPPEWQRMMERVCNPDDAQLDTQITEMRSLINVIKAAGGSEWWAWAQVYRAMGGKVYPAAPDSKSPLGDSHGSTDATSDLDTIRGWMSPGGYYGHTITDDHNMFAVMPCIDVDRHDGKADGLATLQALEAEMGEPLPPTLSRTKADGSGHRFYRVPQGFTIRDKNGVLPGIDLKGFVKNSALVAPSRVGDYVYKFDDNGYTIPVYLPVRWAEKLQELTDKRGAVSAAGIFPSAAAALDDQARDDVHEVIREFMATVAAKSMSREDWVVVMAAAKNSGFDPEELRPWSELDASKRNGFDTAWNSDLRAHPTTILKDDFLQSYGIQNPSTVRKEQAAQARVDQEQAEKAARLEALGLGAMPGHIPRKVTPTLPVEAVEVWARELLAEFTGDGVSFPEGSERQFVAGGLLRDEAMMLPHMRKKPTRSNSKVLRSVITHDDGSKPTTEEGIQWDRVRADLVMGGSDIVLRLGNNIKAKLADGFNVKGRKPNPTEEALTRRIVEISPYGVMIRELEKANKLPVGWSLHSIIAMGLGLATGAPEAGNAISEVSSIGFDFSAANNFQRGGSGTNKRSAEQRIVDAAADAQLGDVLAYDAKYGLFYLKRGDIFEKQESAHNINRVMRTLAEDNGISHTFRTLEGAAKLLATSMNSVRFCEDHTLVPMVNGVLDVTHRELRSYAACSPFNWQLPYAYEPGAGCPTFMEFLNTSLEGDGAAVRVIQAFLHCAFVGDSSAEKFLEITGSGGTGKSTLATVITKLIGKNNAQSTSFKRLEENRYEPAALYGARLIIIPDAKKYAGDMETFKNLTGHDPLPFEQKHVQRVGGTDFVSNALVLVTGNGDIKSSETSSGILRRRLKIKFNRIVSDQEKAKFAHVGGISTVLEMELPGIVNWALSISTVDALATLRNPGNRLRALAEETARNNDPVLAWLSDYCIQCAEGEETPIGTLPAGGGVSIPAVGLYPHFVNYCDGEGIHHKQTANSFTASITDHCNRRGIRTEHKQVWKRGNPLYGKKIIAGIRLRTDKDEQDTGFFGDER